MEKNKKIIGLVSIVVLILLCLVLSGNKSEIKTVKSEKQLLNLYNNSSTKDMPLIAKLLTLPFSPMISGVYTKNSLNTQWSDISTYKTDSGNSEVATTNDSKTTGTTRDYSKTNIQVEGVDEADIIKTDGDYIYSISKDSVIITSAKKENDVKVISTITEGDSIPMDLLLYKDKLVVISASSKTYNSSTSKYNWYYNTSRNTIVSIYNIKNKKNPKLVKSFELKEDYNTTRCIDGNLYIFSNGYLRKDGNKIDREYKENSKTKEIKLNNIKYLADDISNNQTLIAETDLNNLDKDIKVSSYLIDMSDAYVSKNNIYLVDEYYGDSNNPKLKDLFGLKGIYGVFKSYDYDYSQKTRIYKFEINKNKGVKYLANTKAKGKIVNQYSLDEKDGNLRVALEETKGTRVSVYNKRLKLIGETEKVAAGERMYASRFMNNKAYLVTYKNTDPLFVIDLSNPKNPKVLGELKIPGYSTYLHPYDDNHLIGIGMDTKQRVNRSSTGKVISTWTEITGMKMCLFDVSDVNNPKEIDKTTIGDRYTTSAILTNPKALLFSKEKELLAIPVNNYEDEFSVRDSTNYEDEINNYTRNSKDYISEGYLVYKINLKGFKLKGTITHEKESNNKYYGYGSKLLRGLYIDDNLYTVSEDYIKLNKLKDLKEIKSLKIEGEKENEK